MFEVIVSSEFFLGGTTAVVEVTESFEVASKAARDYSVFMGRDAIVRRCNNVTKAKADLLRSKRFIES